MQKNRKEFEKEKLYSNSLINTIIDSLWIINAQGETIDVNQAMVRILEYDSKKNIKENIA